MFVLSSVITLYITYSFFSVLFFFSYIIIIIITINIIISHQSGLDRPVLASPNSLFKGLPSRLRPFCPQVNTFGI